MSPAEQLQRLFHADQLRALNRLVFAAEVLEAPELPEVPDWDKSPQGVETLDSSDFEEMRKLALEWQALAGKLDDILRELSLDDHENELAGIRDKAKAARIALIELDVYSPGPGDGS